MAVSEAQKKASEKWEAEIEQIKIRVPKGTRKLLNDYVEEEYKKTGDTEKYCTYTGKYYKPSLGAFIKYLIEIETGIDMTKWL